MATTEILPFATSGSANVESQAAYAVDSSTADGYSSGILPSNKLNKVLRQLSFMASGLANWMVGQGVSVPDDGNLSGLVTKITTALTTFLNGSVAQNFFTGGTTTGTASAQVLASVSPSNGLSLSNNGQSICLTSGFAPTGATTLQITSPAIPATAIKKPGTGGTLVNLTGDEWAAGETIFLTVNTTNSCYELQDSPPLGTAAAKAASDNTKAKVASVPASTTVGNVPTYGDTAGTLGTGFAPVFTKSYSTTGQAISLGGSLTLAHLLGVAPKLIMTSIVCTSAEAGYSVGDELIVNLGDPFSGTSVTPSGGAITIDATNIKIKWSNGSAVFNSMLDKSTGALAALTESKWTLSVRAFA